MLPTQLRPELVGKVVESVEIGNDNNGYDYVTVMFTDGSCLSCYEIGQTGEIKVLIVTM